VSLTAVSLLGLDPAAYVPSALHSPERTFRETNCYVDVWIELLHALGIDPAGALACAVSVDFEGDQWTFYKPRAEDLLLLYGIDVHEMQLYRPTLTHVTSQLRAGRTMTIEVDSFYLPDTAGSSYRREHVKSTIAIEAVDAVNERLRYFHGAGYHELSGEDFRGVFRLREDGYSADVLPPYVELVRFDAGPRLEGGDLRRAAIEALRREVNYRPSRNPWIAFGERLAIDLPDLLGGTERDYHAYAFATVRQCGAAFESAKSFVEWLCPSPCGHATAAADALGRMVAGVKALLFKLARRRAFDSAPAIRQMASDWEISMEALDALASGNGGL
jgi:Domain of unknown function (DUF1839)